MRAKKLLNVQVLRALAALSVVICHIPIFGIGAFGVDIFFVISGYIICHVTADGERDFFLRRIFRFGAQTPLADALVSGKRSDR